MFGFFLSSKLVFTKVVSDKKKRMHNQEHFSQVLCPFPGKVYTAKKNPTPVYLHHFFSFYGRAYMDTGITL